MSLPNYRNVDSHPHRPLVQRPNVREQAVEVAAEVVLRSQRRGSLQRRRRRRRDDVGGGRRARDELTPSQLKALNEAVKALDAQGVIAITGDCGAFVHCQKEVRKLTKTPVALSSLMQAPLLASMYTQEEKAIIFPQTDAHAHTHARTHAFTVCV